MVKKKNQTPNTKAVHVRSNVTGLIGFTGMFLSFFQYIKEIKAFVHTVLGGP